MLSLLDGTGTRRPRVARRRIRSIKPEFFGDEKVISLSRDARYTMVGLVSLADDRGRLRERPLEILGAIYPEEKVASKHLGAWMEEIVGAVLAKRYEVKGHKYLWLPSFIRHQNVEKPTESELPPHPDDKDAGEEIKDVYKRLKGRDRSGKDRGDLPDKSPKRPRHIRDESGLTRASYPIPSYPIPEVATSVDASASDFAAVADVCQTLNDSGLWGDLISPGAVESVAGEFPDVDLVKAAHLANAWASDSTWEIRSASASLRAAARKQDGERQGIAARDERKATDAQYDAQMEVMSA
jgi:hypothetical protein